MTWTIKLTYQHDDGSHPDFTMQSKITDMAVNQADFDVLAYEFERITRFMKEKAQEEKK